MMKPLEKGSRPVRLLIADDHQIFRAGLRRLLESERDFIVVGEGKGGAEAVGLVRQTCPDVLLIDPDMSKMAGVDTVRQLATSLPLCRTVLLAAAIEKPQIVEALQLGVRGVVLKDSATHLLFKCVRAVMAGEFWVEREMVAHLIGHLRRVPPKPHPSAAKFGLTPRELQVITTVVAGLSNKAMAERLSISEDTVKHHLSNIFDKLGVSSRLELALFAINHHLIAE
jgi:DNA-binding NarL/FixJ family response regulator